VSDVGRGLDRGFRDADDSGGNAVGEGAEQVLVELEGGEVACVDADELRPEVDGAVELFAGVGLDQRRHAELGDEVEELGHQGLLQGGHDEQHEVGAGRPRLEDLVRVGDEVFAQHGQRHGGTHGFEVGERTAELAALGEHADDARSPGLVGAGEGGGIGDLGEGAARRARALHLGDDLDPFGWGQVDECVEGGGARQSCRLDVGHAAARPTLRSVCESSGYEGVEHSSCGPWTRTWFRRRRSP
jgi:hypothetical protein